MCVKCYLANYKVLKLYDSVETWSQRRGDQGCDPSGNTSEVTEGIFSVRGAERKVIRHGFTFENGVS